MSNRLFHSFILSSVLLSAASCASDNDNGDLDQESGQNTLKTQTYQVLDITADLPSVPQSASFQWSITEGPEALYTLTNANQLSPRFITDKAGKYKLQLTCITANEEIKKEYTIEVKDNPVKATRYLTNVFDYCPAPGQFVNVLPAYENGDTAESMRQKAEKAIAGKANGDIVTLGGYGGFITIGFNHTIINVEGEPDFRVLGNAFINEIIDPQTGETRKGGSSEPGIIRVAFDANHNGLPDDEWYEIAGSEYDNPESVKDYEITYFRPQSEEAQPVKEGYCINDSYIRWEDNQGISGYRKKIIAHTQSYFPLWLTDTQLSFKGTRLPDNAIDMSGDGSNWVLFAFAAGYADNLNNSDSESAIDISLSVDKEGNPVVLPGIDFIQIYTGINQECGHIGETSTEITGAEDLHIR